MLPSVLILIETICPKICSKSRLKCAKSPFPVDVRRSKTSLLKLPNNPRQSWILDSKPWIPDSRYWITDMSVELGLRITIVSGILDSLSSIPDSTSKNF